jgi:diadenosine tetraphosphate (Ap4A) HIT family hydrolase
MKTWYNRSMVETRTELYTSLGREPNMQLPPLLTDAREHALVQAHSDSGIVHVKDVANPTARKHMLVIPDQTSRVLMGDVSAVPVALLRDTFHVVGDIARYYEAQAGTEQVDVMINYSTDPLKRIQTQPNLHVHVIGWGAGDIHRPTNREEIKHNPELRPQVVEPLHSVIHDLLEQQVFPAVATDPAFHRLFERISDEHGAITYRLPQGEETFSDPDLSRLIQAIHTRSHEVYTTIASAYFARNTDHGGFVEGRDERYVLLPTQQRVENIERYRQEHPGLSEASQRWLHFLAVQATDLETMVENKQLEDQMRPDGQRKNPTRRDLMNRFVAIQDLSYACVFSGLKKDDRYAWEFGFDPIVFSTRGGLQASRGVQKVGIRDTNMSYDTETLQDIKASERRLGKYLVEKNDGIRYQPGPDQDNS